MPLEALYTGYRQNVMAADEVLAWIKVPLPDGGRVPGSTRSPNGLTTIFRPSAWPSILHLEDGRIRARVDRRRRRRGHPGAGAPDRGLRWQGQPGLRRLRSRHAQVLRAEFEPITDMRASAAYRSEVLGNLVQRFWPGDSGPDQINLDRNPRAGETA
jgi:xanthine dehydrogenase small subunit